MIGLLPTVYIVDFPYLVIESIFFKGLHKVLFEMGLRTVSLLLQLTLYEHLCVYLVYFFNPRANC